MNLLVLFFLTLGVSNAMAEIVERVSAIVNDQVILQSDVTEYKKGLQKGGMVDELLIEDAKAVSANPQKLLDVIINEKIIDSEVKSQNLEVTVERVQSEIRDIARRNRMGVNQLKETLAGQGVDFAEYQEFVKNRLERQSLIEKVVTSKIKISDEDVAAYYITNNPSTGREAFQYTLAHILFVPKLNDWESAKQRALNALEKLKSGISFETLASQASEDPNFSKDGFLGVFKSGEFLPELEAAAKPLPAGAHTEIVKTKAGFHIVKVLDKKLVSSPEFEAAREKIRGLLYQQAFKKQFSFWLDQKHREAFIRINK